MKTALSISGRVELTRQEVSIAIAEYLKKHHTYKAIKTVYLPSNDNFVGAVVEVIQATATDNIPEFKVKEKSKRNQKRGYVRKNMGIFDTIRDIIAHARKLEEKHLSLEYLFKEVKFFHQELEQKVLQSYLGDTRQLKDVRWKGREKILYLL